MIAHPDKIFHFFKYITLNYTPRTSFSQLITKFDLKVLSVNLWLYIFCASCLLYLPCEALLWGFYSRIIRSQVKNWVMFVCSGRRLTWQWREMYGFLNKSICVISDFELVNNCDVCSNKFKRKSILDSFLDKHSN